MLGVVRTKKDDQKGAFSFLKKFFTIGVLINFQNAGADGLFYYEIIVAQYKGDKLKAIGKRLKKGLKKAKKMGVDTLIYSRNFPKTLSKEYGFFLFEGWEFKKICALEMMAQIKKLSGKSDFCAAVFDPSLSVDYGFFRKIADSCQMIYLISKREKAKEVMKSLTDHWGICVTLCNDMTCVSHSDFILLFNDPPSDVPMGNTEEKALIFDLRRDKSDLADKRLIEDFDVYFENLIIPENVSKADFLGWFYRDYRSFNRALLKIRGVLLCNGEILSCLDIASYYKKA